MRIALTISAVAHAMMWVPLVLPGPDPLVPAAETAIVAEIVTEQDLPEPSQTQAQTAPSPTPTPAAETANAAEQPPTPPSKQEARAQERAPASKVKAQNQKVASATPATPQAMHPEPTPPETQSSQSPSAPPQIWGSWLDSAMTSPLAAKASGMDPAEQGAKIPQKDIDQFKARLQSCWKPPASLAEAGNLMVVLRISLKPNGALEGEPSLIAASGSEAGPVLMRAAMQALRECQPYAFLPAKQHKEWKLLDLAFSPGGLTGLPRI